ncbi:MAG: hypothetical protein ACKVHP_12465, partial [Verrucomicrobiales bacterium]
LVIGPQVNGLPLQAVIEASSSLEPGSWEAISDVIPLSLTDSSTLNATEAQLNGHPFVRRQLTVTQ